MIRITTDVPLKSYHIDDLEPGTIAADRATNGYTQYYLIIYNGEGEKFALYLGDSAGIPAYQISRRLTFNLIVGRLENVKD